IGLTILLFEDSISEADRIKKLSEDLYETNRLKDLLITSISQELQTPIQSIENMTKIINENDGNKNENRKRTQLIEAASKQMSITLDNLLDITNLQEGDLNIKKEVISIYDIVEKVIPIYQFQHAKDVTIQMDISKDSPEVYADEQRMIQIISILLQNALKY